MNSITQKTQLNQAQRTKFNNCGNSIEMIIIKKNKKQVKEKQNTKQKIYNSQNSKKKKKLQHSSIKNKFFHPTDTNNANHIHTTYR